MDEEAITWNLKGPKRMRKRRELNALLKNNQKYKNILKENTNFDLLNVGTSRLLANQNDSSSDNEDYYFSANKFKIRQKRRGYYCKIIKMILFGFVVTFSLLVGIILVFSYAKFHDVLNDLKYELQSQTEKNQKSIDQVKRQLNDYDSLFKQFSTYEIRISSLESLEDKNQKSNSKNKSNRAGRQFSRSIRSTSLEEDVNTYLIEWLFNQTFVPEKENEILSLINESISNKLFSDKIKLRRKIILNEYYSNSTNLNSLIDEFFKKKNAIYFGKNSQDEERSKQILLNDIENKYIKPIVEGLESCKCSNFNLTSSIKFLRNN